MLKFFLLKTVMVIVSSVPSWPVVLVFKEILWLNILLRRATSLGLGTLISRHSFALPAGAFSLNLLLFNFAPESICVLGHSCP